MEDGKGLANNTLRNVDQKDFKEIYGDLKKSVEKLRNKKDIEYSKKMSVVSLLPTW